MSKPRSVRHTSDLLRDVSGTTAIEYALIASGVAGVIIIAVLTTGTSLQSLYQTIVNSLN